MISSLGVTFKIVTDDEYKSNNSEIVLKSRIIPQDFEFNPFLNPNAENMLKEIVSKIT